MLELLAPAGSMEALRAAVQNGANAVYLGVGPFNARQGARNFTLETLREAVQYAHIRGVAVHLTVNTLVSVPRRQSSFGRRPGRRWTPSLSRIWASWLCAVKLPPIFPFMHPRR